MQYFPPRNLVAAFLIIAFVMSAGTAAWARKHRVRITTDAVEVKGWEQALCRNNPNLKHWHWNPIYGNPQSHIYVEPENEPDYFHRMVKKQKQQNPGVVIAPRKSVYVKYIHLPNIPPPPKKETNVILTANNLNGRLSHENVAGQLSHEKVGAMLSHEKVGGMLANRDVSAQLASRDVSGQLRPATYDSYSRGSGLAFTDSYRQNTQGAVYGQIASTRKPRTHSSSLHF